MSGVNWSGLSASWDPATDSYVIAVMITITRDGTIPWLDRHLVERLRRDLGVPESVRAHCPPPMGPTGPASKITKIFITGLTEPLPDPGSVRRCVDAAFAEAEGAVEQHLRLANEYAARYEAA